MIVDSSALVAIAAGEPERERFVAKIDAAEFAGVGAPTLVETGIVLARRGMLLVDHLLEVAPVTVVEFGEAHWREALDAWSRFGRSRHPADLDFGDCLAYATAKVAGMPLLAKGGDFALTGIQLA